MELNREQIYVIGFCAVILVGWLVCLIGYLASRRKK